MVTLDDCSHMEIKKIYECNIITIGRKAVCCIDIADVNEYSNPRRLHVAISNIFTLMQLFNIDKLNRLVGEEVKCMVHGKFREINFISPLIFEDQTDKDYVYCNQVEIEV